MSRKLFLDAAPGERRGVVALGGQPEHLLIERDGEPDRPRLGETWRGRVGAAAPGFRGFFVDLDCGPAALLAAEAGARPPEGAVLEVEITALLCKTKARTYEVPISYYGRPYEEGKKIGFMDGVAALWYIGYYNLVKPLTPSGRLYVSAVNESLAKKGIGVAAGN